MFKPPLIVLAAIAMAAQPQASGPEQRFEAAVVKHYDHRNDHATPFGLAPLFGCYIGPGRLQYNCSGPVTKLMAEALNLSDFQFAKSSLPEYVVTAKLSRPATRQQLDDMLANFLQERMGVRYHLERRPIEGEFLTVVSQELLKKLPVSHDQVPLADAWSGPASMLGSPMVRFGQFVDSKAGPVKGEIQLTCTNINFYLLAQLLHRYYEVPVIDETGLTQRFDLAFAARWDLEELKEAGGMGPAGNLSEIRKLLSTDGVSLRLRKGVTDFLVIDQIANEAKFLN
jgi:uncharacterized protein (TIGR03435 family)